MTANWEAALAQSSGDYINILGDDDGLMPHALLRASQIIDESGTEILSWFRWPYFWPTATSPTQRDSLYITLADPIQKHSCRQALIAFYQNELGFEYMPMLYNSFVKRSVINKIKNSNHSQYFSSLCFSPDIYSGIVNAYFSESYLFSNIPFSLSGISGHSNGFAIANPQFGKASATQFLAEHKDPELEMIYPGLPKMTHPGVLLISDQLRVREQFFANDGDIVPNALKLLRMMVAGMASDAVHYSYHYEAVAAIATSFNIPLEELGLHHGDTKKPESSPTLEALQQRFEGWLGDPRTATNAIVDCSRLGISTIDHACTFFGSLLNGSIPCTRESQILEGSKEDLRKQVEGDLPLVSVAIPTYNRSTLLQKALQSVLHQDYANIEIVIFDNASTDDTQVICQQLASLYSNIRYFRQSHNRGSVENFKAALAASTGHYFMWLGDDDWLEPNYVSACLNFLRNHPDCVLAYGQPEYLLEDGTHLYSGKNFDLSHTLPQERVRNYYQYVTDNGLFYGLMRREYINRISYPVGMGSDWLMMSALSFLGQIRFCQSTKIFRLHKALQSSRDIENAYIEGAERDGLPKLHGYYPHLAIAISAHNSILYDPIYKSLELDDRQMLSVEVARTICNRHQCAIPEHIFQTLAILDRAREEITSLSLWRHYRSLRSSVRNPQEVEQLNTLITLACDRSPKSVDPLSIHFFTLVLNGRPFIEYHIKVLETLPFEWHWHIVEGVADLKHDTAWSVANGAFIDPSIHDKGLSIDGTTQYINQLQERYPERISIYRKTEGKFWDGKLEMVRAPLKRIDQECLLWQLDCDEYWTPEQLCTARQLFLEQPDKLAAFYWCWFFVGPEIVISTRNCYSQNPNQEWLRTWRYKPGMQWLAHEPPILGCQVSPNQWADIARINYISHDETERYGLIFQHFAYVFESQLIFKENYYGYRNALAGWRQLQNNQHFPTLLSNYFHWVNDMTEVALCSSLGIQPLLEVGSPDNASQYASRVADGCGCLQKNDFPKVVVDAVFFQIARTGIARVWLALLQEWVKTGFSKKVIVLNRAGTAPLIEGIRYIDVPAYDYSKSEEDRWLIQEICDRENAQVFISTYYTTPVSTPFVFMAHDMIPEIIGCNLQDRMWQEKAYAARHASAYICVSNNTARDLIRFYPEVCLKPVQVAHNGVSPCFHPPSRTELSAFKAHFGIEKPYFILSGVRGGYKNIGLFFKAFARLPNRTDFEIVCTGTNLVLEEEWQQYVQGVKVHMLYLSDDGLRNAYAGALALVYPSQYEGFGLPVLEAMACGCPVITCPNASIPEVGGDAVLYVDDSDILGMTGALQQIQDPLCRQGMITQGFEQSQKFSWSDMAMKLQLFLLGVACPSKGVACPSKKDYFSFNAGNHQDHPNFSAQSTPYNSPETTNATSVVVQNLGRDITSFRPSTNRYVVWLLNRLNGILRVHHLDSNDEQAIALIQELRQQMAEHWLTVDDDALAQNYTLIAEQGYRVLLGSGIQDVRTTASEQALLSALSKNVIEGIEQPIGIKSLLGVMLYFSPGKMQVRDAKHRLPAWLLPDYQAVFEPNEPSATTIAPQPIAPAPQASVPLYEDMTFLNRLLGCANLYYIDPEERSIADALRLIRQQVGQIWAQTPFEHLEALYRSEFGRRYVILLESGYQHEPLRPEEESVVQELTGLIGQGIDRYPGLNALLAIMMYLPPGKMQVRNAAERLPAWLLPDYQRIFEAGAAQAPSPIAPPPPAAPAAPAPSPIAPPAPPPASITEDMVFLNRFLGCSNLYEIDPDDPETVAELRHLRRQVAEFWLTVPADRLETTFNTEFGRRYGSFLKSGFQREPLTEEERNILVRLAETVARGLEQPGGLNAFLGAMMYYAPGQMQVKDAATRLPGWLYPLYAAVFESEAQKKILS